MKNTPQPQTEWDRVYANRTARLRQLLAMNAPVSIIENECRLVLKAIARSKRGYLASLRWIGQDLGIWLAAIKVETCWAWKRRVCGWSEEKCEEHFLGFKRDLDEHDPALAELNRIFNNER